MDMLILAQEAASDATAWETLRAWSFGRTVAFGYKWTLRPLVGLPLLFLALAVAGRILRTILVHWLTRLTAKTSTNLDDVVLGSLASAVYPLLFLVGLESVVVSTALGASPLSHRILHVVAIIVVAVIVVRMVLVVVDAWVQSRPSLVPLGPPIKLAVKIAWVPLVLLTVLSAIDVEIIQFVTTLGVGSLAIALAMQDTLANLFSGVQLVVDQPIRAGDFIELESGQRGIVFEIGLRSTKIRTLNNNVIIVPNSVLAKTMIVNNEAYDRRYAHRFYVGVGYDSDSRHVQRVLEEVLEEAGRTVDRVLPGPHSVRFVEFGDSALNFRIEVSLSQYPNRRGPLSELHHMIHERFRAEGIEIPFPMRTVILRHEDGTPPESLDDAPDRPPEDQEPAPVGFA